MRLRPGLMPPLRESIPKLKLAGGLFELVWIWVRRWDRELIRARGVALGQEFKGKGVNVALGKSLT